MEFYLYVTGWIAYNIIYMSSTVISSTESALSRSINFRCTKNPMKIVVNFPLGTTAVDVYKTTFDTCPYSINIAKTMEDNKINNTKWLILQNPTGFVNITLIADYFDGLHNVERLALRNIVDIESIAETAFQYFDKLKELKLEDNKMQLTDGIFKHLTKLEELTIGYNELPYIPPNIFENLTELCQLYLSDSRFTTINNYMFNNLKNLTHLELKNMQLEHVPQDIFHHLENLRQIDLSSNKFRSVPKDLFRNNKLLKVIRIYKNPNITSLPNNLFFNLINLKTILLHECNLRKLPNELFEKLINLHRLDLQSNQIDHVPTNIFKDLIKLEELNLSSNKIRYLSNEVFFCLSALTFLNLQNNSLTILQTEHFYNLYNLSEVYLSHNAITVMGNFTTFAKLKKLDISYNQISSLNFSEVFTRASPIKINLEHNNITTIYFNEDEVMTESKGERVIVVYLDGNSLECNCHMYNFVRYLERNEDLPVFFDDAICKSPHNVINVMMTELKPQILTCSLQELKIEEKFTDKCLYTFRPWDKSLIIRCTNSNFTEVPDIILPKQNFFNQTILHLEGNLLISGPKENMGYENVTQLFLSTNYINEITWLPPKLQVLDLDNNNINYLDDELLNAASLITNISLGKNRWNCDCTTMNLISFLSRKHIDTNTTTITCKDGSTLPLYPDSNMICPSNKVLVLGLGITFILIVVLIVLLIAFYYRYQEEVKAWLFAHNIFLWFVTENENDKDKIYDAFISYSHEDENFVLNELLPVLEKFPQQYIFCLKIHNWAAGELICKQINKTVAESRRTIVILSRNLLNSEWGKMEFRTAHVQAIHDGARVILVLYGDIDMESDLDDELKAYIRTNTYVRWGDRWFWDKLRYALPHSSVLRKTQNGTLN